MHNSSISMTDIINIIIEYTRMEILKFSKSWMSQDAFKLEYNDTMATKIDNGNHWIVPDIEPVTKGKVCWRVKVVDHCFSHIFYRHSYPVQSL